MDDRHAERPLRVPVLDRYNDRGTMVLGKVEQVRLGWTMARGGACDKDIAGVEGRYGKRCFHMVHVVYRCGWELGEVEQVISHVRLRLGLRHVTSQGNIVVRCHDDVTAMA